MFIFVSLKQQKKMRYNDKLYFNVLPYRLTVTVHHDQTTIDRLKQKPASGDTLTPRLPFGNQI